MAAKFSMTNGMFDAGDHAEASDRMQHAMEELKERNELIEQIDKKQAIKDEAKKRQEEFSNQLDIHISDDTYNNENHPTHDEESEDEDEYSLMNDPELDRLRELRLATLKKEHIERQENIGKGHGQYREIVQDEFLAEVTGSEYVLVHFYHRDFEKCKVIDMHLSKMVPHHLECKFLKLDAEKAPFFVEKLSIRVLPTIIGFLNGVALPERMVGFQDLSEGLTFGGESEFPTSALARKLVTMGVIKLNDATAFDDAKGKRPTGATRVAIRSSALCENDSD